MYPNVFQKHFGTQLIVTRMYCMVDGLGILLAPAEGYGICSRLFLPFGKKNSNNIEIRYVRAF